MSRASSVLEPRRDVKNSPPKSARFVKDSLDDGQGKLTIVGDSHDLTVIDGKNLDRVFKVHQNASLTLQRLTITGGDSPAEQGGGGILSAGHVE